MSPRYHKFLPKKKLIKAFEFIKRLGRWQWIYIIAIEGISNGVLNSRVFSSSLSCCFLLSLLSTPYAFLTFQHRPHPICVPFQSLLETSLLMSFVSLSPFTQALSLSSSPLVSQSIFLNKDISFSKRNISTNFQDIFNIIGGWKMILIPIVLVVSNTFPTLFH